MYLLDLYQRIYSDDGHGNGYINREGVLLLGEYTDSGPWGKTNKRFGAVPSDFLLGPAASAVVASRREMTALTESLLDEAEQELNLPFWQWKESSVEAAIKSLYSSQLDRVRYAPLVSLIPGVRAVAVAAELAKQQRDVTLTAIALIVFHRQHGVWPADLNHLSPDLLPKLLPDRFTGQPLSYRLKDGQPVLYSVGPDKKDDGGVSFEALGRPAENDDDVFSRFPDSTYQNERGERRATVGDRVLWPPARPAEASTE
jgi:hypothetical protein